MYDSLRAIVYCLTKIYNIACIIFIYIYITTDSIRQLRVYGYWRARAEGAGLAGSSHRLCKPTHWCLDGVCEHAGDVVPPRVPVDGAAGFVVAVTLGPGVEEVADLPRRVAGAAPVHFEDEREEARPGWGAERGRGRHVAVEAVALAAGRRVGGGHAHAAVEVALGGADIAITTV